VIAVGPGAPDKEGRIVPTSVKTGDRVLLPGWGGNAIKVGEDVRFLFLFLILFLLYCLNVEADDGYIGISSVQGFGDFGKD
jgi:Chaperonin 10 Kd subunit